MAATNSKPSDEKAQARELATEELDQVSGGILTNNENIITGLRPKGGLKIGPKSLESETEDE
jgi:hypothetical protein